MIGIIGSGAWGTALAQVYAQAGNEVLIWARRPEVADAINEQRENTSNLPGIALHPGITATLELSHMAEKEIILIATPAQHARAAMGVIKRWLPEGKPVVICAKGIELESGKLMSQAAEDEIPQASIAILTGPTFASEIARDLPSAVTIAAQDMGTAEKIQDMLMSRTLRPYASDDLIGAQVGGAVKNVIAIACGMAMGMELGENARAALVTRGLAEIARLTVALGGRKETLLGLSGVGDLMLTASSMQSRNYSLGFRLGQGETIDAILGARKAVTEGVHTARALSVMAAQQGVDMPISAAVNDCVNNGASPKETLYSLLERRPRKELE